MALALALALAMAKFTMIFLVQSIALIPQYWNATTAARRSSLPLSCLLNMEIGQELPCRAFFGRPFPVTLKRVR